MSLSDRSDNPDLPALKEKIVLNAPVSKLGELIHELMKEPAAKNSSRYGVMTGSLVMSGMCIARMIPDGAIFTMAVVFLPVIFGVMAGLVSHSGEGK